MLMRLHDGMEQAAATLAEGWALALLGDNALTEQFAQGVRQQSVRQELRRLTLASVGRPFFQMRDEALVLLREDEEHSRRMRVCTICVDQAQSEHVGESWSQVPGSSASASETVLSQILQTQQQRQQTANDAADVATATDCATSPDEGGARKSQFHFHRQSNLSTQRFGKRG